MEIVLCYKSLRYLWCCSFSPAAFPAVFSPAIAGIMAVAAAVTSTVRVSGLAALAPGRAAGITSTKP
jgi:hypothetical protein